MKNEPHTTAINPLTAVVFRELFREEALHLAECAKEETDPLMRTFYALESATRIILVRLFHTLRPQENGSLEWPTSVDVHNLRTEVHRAIQYLTKELGENPGITNIDDVISRADELLLEKKTPELPEEID